MSLCGCRPAVVSSPSSRKRLPELGPRRTTRSAEPSGSASTAACASGESAGICVWPVTSESYASSPEMEMVDVVSEGRSGVAPGRSGAPQLEQKRLFSALRLPHLVHTRADMDGSSCRGCPPGAWEAYGSPENPPPALEVDGCPKPMPPAWAGSTDGAP